MYKHSIQFIFFAFLLIISNACSSEDINASMVSQEESDESEEANTNDNIDSNSLATIGCQNVVIVNDFAYAACGNGIEVISLETLERNFLNFSADDITSDSELELLFTQSGNTLRMLDLSSPMEPSEIEVINTNFGIFSGIAAANGILVVSAGTGGSNTQVYTYTETSINLTNNGIPLVDGVTGNPDVHVAATDNGVTAFYSQDLGAVANWGIQIVEFDLSGTITSTPPVVVLTARRFTGSFGVPFGPANFPTESEFLNNQLYVAHFAAPGIHIIDLQDDNALNLIPLSYEPTNIATDGNLLFVVGVTETTVDIIDPIDNTISNQISANLEQPIGVAASETHIVIADRSVGLVVITR